MEQEDPIMDLKPCPFCGGQAEFDCVAAGRPCRLFAIVQCRTCGNGTKIFQTEDRYGNKMCGEFYAAESWNRRTAE